ncbi:hypothetical protein HDV63DRAFT_358186 [Trichoderma sp. SZMC 28014]
MVFLSLYSLLTTVYTLIHRTIELSLCMCQAMVFPHAALRLQNLHYLHVLSKFKTIQNVYNSKNSHNQSVVYHIVLSSKVYLANVNLNAIVLQNNPVFETFQTNNKRRENKLKKKE